MTASQFTILLKRAFFDYFFIRVDGKMPSLLSIVDLVETYCNEIEKSVLNNDIMKVDFKTNKETIIAINGLLAYCDSINFDTLSKPQKRVFAMRQELRFIFIKKTMLQNDKPMKIKLPYYLAEELLDILLEYSTTGIYHNGIDQLKNELHQKLI